MAKLKKEELIKTLRKWTYFFKPHIHHKEIPYWLPKDQQAYEQIKSLIKSKPEVSIEKMGISCPHCKKDIHLITNMDVEVEDA